MSVFLYRICVIEIFVKKLLKSTKHMWLPESCKSLFTLKLILKTEWFCSCNCKLCQWIEVDWSFAIGSTVLITLSVQDHAGCSRRMDSCVFTSVLLHQYDKARQTVYVWRNTEPLSCNHCCCGKAISVSYSGYVFVVLGIQHAMRMRHIVICGLPRSTILFHIIS